jgi:hypothetical protein
MLTPTIHLNGTSREALLRGFADAADAVRDALAAVQATYPNGRDFYPQGPGAITQAMGEHRQRVQTLEELRAQFLALAEATAREG